MPRHSVTLLVLFAILPLTHTSLEAQRGFGRFQRESNGWRPDGRLLREILGQSEDDEEDAEDRDSEFSQRMRSAFGPRIEQPSPTRSRERTGEYRFNQDTDAWNKYDERSRTLRLESLYRSAAETSSHPRKLEVALKPSRSPKGLVVDKISKQGAAWLAGIREGDVLTKVGGLNVATKEELASVLRILKDGDQIEFEYARRGKEKTAIVQFGDAETEPSQDQTLSGTRVPSQLDLIDFYNRPKKIKSELNQSKYDDYLLRNTSSRIQEDTSNQQTEINLDIEKSDTKETFRRSKPTQLNSRSEISRLRKELENKQHEIDRLQRKLKQTGADENTYTESELNSLFDTGD